MSYFSTRTESNVLVIEFETASGLNDFRNNRSAIPFTNSSRLRRNRGLPSTFFKVDYLSSSGVALLVGLKRRVETRGGKIVLYRVQPIVRDLLAVMKLDKFFTNRRQRTTGPGLTSSGLHGLIRSFAFLDTLDSPSFQLV